MSNKRLALDVDGNLTYCEARPENVGKGRCNHIAHHDEDNETVTEFLECSEEVYNRTTLEAAIKEKVQNNKFYKRVYEFMSLDEEKRPNMSVELEGTSENPFLRVKTDIIDCQINQNGFYVDNNGYWTSSSMPAYLDEDVFKETKLTKEEKELFKDANFYLVRESNISGYDEDSGLIFVEDHSLHYYLEDGVDKDKFVKFYDFLNDPSLLKMHMPEE